jgi:hypothetical protein
MQKKRLQLHTQEPPASDPQRRFMDVTPTLIDQPALSGVYDAASGHVILTIAYPAQTSEEGMALLAAAGLNRFLADVMNRWKEVQARNARQPGDVTGMW